MHIGFWTEWEAGKPELSGRWEKTEIRWDVPRRQPLLRPSNNDQHFHFRKLWMNTSPLTDRDSSSMATVCSEMCTLSLSWSFYFGKLTRISMAHTFIHWWQRLPCKVATCSSGTIQGLGYLAQGCFSVQPWDLNQQPSDCRTTRSTWATSTLVYSYSICSLNKIWVKVVTSVFINLACCEL